MTTLIDPAAPRAYRPIADYGVIGDTCSAALVARDGAIDWYCAPRFDAPPLFARLLDAGQGGAFTLSSAAPFTVERRYLSGSNVLETIQRTSDGVLRLTDFMDLSIGPPGGIIRRVEALAGEIEVEIGIDPRAGWRSGQPRFVREPWGVMIAGGHREMALTSSAAIPWQERPGLHARLLVKPGAPLWLRLAPTTGAEEPLTSADAEEHLEETLGHWRRWIARCCYEGPYREAVERSALALKLLTYAPSGAIVAAPTTSLPETLGGVRNWDYRYVWLRDAAFVLNALQDVGYHDEAMAFWRYIEALGFEEELLNFYTVEGERPPQEVLIEDLDGYMNSRPVRVGNDAADQLQLDLYGELMEATYTCQVRMGEPHPRLQPVLRRLIAQATQQWREPDTGIWELRGEPRHLLHSKVMCWVTLDRAICLAERGWLAGDVEQWRAQRSEIHASVLAQGYHEARGAFTQAYGSDALDATALLLPGLGFIAAHDPRMRATLAAIQQELGRDGLVYRYLADDGLPGREGAFVACSFWLVDALRLDGQLEAAHEVFERILGFSNDLGLLSEQVDPSSGALLGNFPQGLSHLALIRAGAQLGGYSAP